MKSIVVVFHPEAARTLHTESSGESRAASPVARELRSLAERLGVRLTPMHPGASHPTLLPYFNAGPVADDRAEEVVKGLLSSRFVDGAWAQPAVAAALPNDSKKEGD
jgi:hypothetical protein